MQGPAFHQHHSRLHSAIQIGRAFAVRLSGGHYLRPSFRSYNGGIIDLLGTLVEGLYPINPAYTVTLALTGAAIWVVYNFLDKKTNLKLFYKILLTVILIQTLVTFPLNTFWNSFFYVGFNLFWAEAIKRAPSVLFYIITYPVILGTLLPVMWKVLGYNKKSKSPALN